MTASRLSFIGAKRQDEDVLDVFRLGRLSDVVDLTRFHASPTEMLLRGRALLRLGSPAEAIEAVGFDSASLTPAIKAERAMLRASAYARSGDFAAAHHELVDARAFGYGSPFQAVDLDLTVTEASVAFMEGAHAEADRLLASPMIFGSDRASFYKDGAPFWDEHHVLARWHEVQARLAGLCGNRSAQIEHFSLALDSIAASATPDMWLRANIANNFGMMLRESPDPGAMAELQRHTERIAWVDDLAMHRFQLSRSFGFSAALEGNHMVAFKCYREAASYAPTSAYRIMAMIDRVFLSRELGFSRQEFVLDELEEIADVAAQVNWSASNGEEYVALLLLAQIFAKVDVGRAASYFTRYQELHTAAGRHLFGRSDPRRKAAEAATAGAIALARGEISRAGTLLGEACDAYVAVDCHWRAANIAISLLEIDPSAQAAATVAQRVAEQNPSSWIARRLAEMPAPTAV